MDFRLFYHENAIRTRVAQPARYHHVGYRLEGFLERYGVQYGKPRKTRLGSTVIIVVFSPPFIPPSPEELGFGEIKNIPPRYLDFFTRGNNHELSPGGYISPVF